MNGASCRRNLPAFLALRSITYSVPPNPSRTRRCERFPLQSRKPLQGKLPQAPGETKRRRGERTRQCQTAWPSGQGSLGCKQKTNCGTVFLHPGGAALIRSWPPLRTLATIRRLRGHMGETVPRALLGVACLSSELATFPRLAAQYLH